MDLEVQGLKLDAFIAVVALSATTLTSCSGPNGSSWGQREPDLSKTDLSELIPSTDEISKATELTWETSEPELQDSPQAGASQSPAPSPGSPSFCWMGQSLIQPLGMTDLAILTGSSDAGSLKLTVRRYESDQQAENNVEFVSEWRDKCASNFEALGMQTYVAENINIPNAAKYKLTTLGASVSHVVFRVDSVVTTIDLTPSENHSNRISADNKADEVAERVATAVYDQIMRH
jgi:hypothetical protein